MKLELILKQPIKANNDGIYDYSEPSETKQYFEDYTTNPNIEYVLIKSSKPSNGPKIMTSIVSFLKDRLPEDAVVIEIGGGSASQSRTGKGYQVFKNYYPLDISYPHVKAYTSTYNREGIVCNAENLPFKNQSIDCIYTNAFLEHPTRPDKVVSEIARVIKPGGIVVHNDAWFCRWWQRYGVRVIKPKTTKQKLILLASKITENKLIRIPPIIISRLIKHFFATPKRLHYRKLKPNYSLYLGADEDAASSIDPIDAIRFYEAQGFALINKLSFKQRMFYPNKYIALRKI